jgi:4-amino-4-deoxy-L-arabinose transferase-like glycosyltransferase
MTGRTPTGRILGGVAVACVLALYWVMAVSGSPRMGVTGDEIVHITGGYSYWTLNDYRLHPENGNLAQRLAALPLLGMDLRFPSLDDPYWQASKVNLVGEKFLFHEGNPVARILLASRMMIAATGVLTLWLIWRWSRGLFGAKAGRLALGFAVFSPTLLAHGGLATSDMVMTACVLSALSLCWRLLHRVTWPRLLFAGLACGLAFVSKMSGVIIIPVLGVMVIIRLLHPSPIPWMVGRTIYARSLPARTLTVLGSLTILAAISLAVLWASFGFRYESTPPNRTRPSGYYFSWDVVLSKSPVPQPSNTALDQLLPPRQVPVQTTLDHVVEWTRDHHLLPEPYLWGFAQTTRFSRYRPAYLMGELGTQGWGQFFPIAFLLKTPAGALILGLAGIGALIAMRLRRTRLPGCRPWAYRATPLLVFFALYWVLALSMNLNIGHRHILPTYPIFYVFLSAATLWLSLSPRKLIAAGLVFAVGLQAAESLLVRPFYLSYFQPAFGGPDRGYRYFVDSSFDWGQGLPDLETWLARQQADAEHPDTYLSYFGADSPRYRKFNVIRFGDEIYDSGERIFPANLRGGWYVISATQFVQVYALARGGWTTEKESLYRTIQRRLQEHRERADDSASESLLRDCMDLELLQTARLFTYLKDRRPLEVLGGSLLVFRLSDQEIAAALHSPLPVP